MDAAGELVLPPLSPVLVGRPYAAVPLLSAYAEQRGAGPVRQVNLNQSFAAEVFLERAGQDTDVPDDAAAPGHPADHAAAAEAALLRQFPHAVAESGDPALLAAVARDPAGRTWLFEEAGLSETDGESGAVDVEHFIGRLPRLDRLRGFYRRHYRASGVPRLVGISVPFATQLAPALLLAEVLRELAGDGVFVVLGGPLPSLLDDDQVRGILSGSAVDGTVRREGEEAMLRLLEIAATAPGFEQDRLAGVPSLSYRVDGEIVTRPPAGSPVKLTDTLAAPLAKEYLDGAIELPVMVGRGCFYTCAFCDYIELYERINFRRAEDVTESARLAAEQSTTGALHFVYEVMSLRYERRLARILAAADLGVQWRGFQRVFGELSPEDVRLLEESGCARLDIGLESADDEALRLMNKGYTREEIGSFLTSFAGSSIQLLINIIVDYPGLTHERAMDAARFLAEATKDIDDVHFEVLRFALGRNSEMYRTPERFGLELTPVHAAAAEPTSPTQVTFHSRWAMTEAERADVESFYRELNASFPRRRLARLNASGLLDGGGQNRAELARWDVRLEPMVLADFPDTVVARRMHTGQTFEVPAECRPVLEAYRTRRGRTVPLETFLADAAGTLAEVGWDETDCVELLAELDLLRLRRSPARPGVRVGISSDRNFYRGGVRAGSPGVAL